MGKLFNWSEGDENEEANCFNNSSCAKSTYRQLNCCPSGPNHCSRIYHQSARPDKGFKGATSVSQNRRRPFETL